MLGLEEAVGMLGLETGEGVKTEGVGVVGIKSSALTAIPSLPREIEISNNEKKKSQTGSCTPLV